MFGDSKKKSIIQEIEKEFSENWKDVYYENLIHSSNHENRLAYYDEYDRGECSDFIEEMFDLCKECNSGTLKLSKYSVKTLKSYLSSIEWYREYQDELFKENNDPQKVEQKKKLLEDITQELEKNWKESYTKILHDISNWPRNQDFYVYKKADNALKDIYKLLNGERTIYQEKWIDISSNYSKIKVFMDLQSKVTDGATGEESSQKSDGDGLDILDILKKVGKAGITIAVAMAEAEANTPNHTYQCRNCGQLRYGKYTPTSTESRGCPVSYYHVHLWKRIN